MAGGEVDVEDRTIEAGVGVEIATEIVNGFGDVAGLAGGGSLEDHVFDVMREARAKELAFVDGAGADPDLDGDDRGGVVFLDEGGEAVVHGEPDDGLV